MNARLNDPPKGKALAGDAAQGSGLAHDVSHHCAPNDVDRKAFETLRALAAFRGYTLVRSNPADGPVIYHAGRWGMDRELRTLADAARFVMRIGGGAA